MKTVFLLLFSLTLLPLFAAPSPILPEKTTRYHELLLNRPDSSTLFERFLNAWLDTHSKEELETFLQKKAQDNSPKHALVLNTFHQWVGQETQALATLDQALLRNPDSSLLQLARAKLKAQLLDFEGALNDLEQVGPLSNPEDLLLHGTWLARSGQQEQAVIVWKELLAADPQNEILAEDLIELEVSEGFYKEALETLNKLITDTQDPYQKALRTLRFAEIQERAGQSQEALITYQKLLPQSGQDSWLEKEILAQIEESFRRQDNLTGLREFYQILRQDLPLRISLKKGLAFQMANNGEGEEAIALFREILKITPGDRANRLQFITLLEDIDSFDLALSEVAFLLREQPEDQNLLEHQARLHDLTGNREGLKETLATLTELRGQEANALLATVALYQRYQFDTQAEELLRTTALQFPTLVEPREALASFLANPLHDEAKQAEATQIWLTLANNTDAEGLLRVARSLQNNNRPQECFQLLQSRLPDFPNNALLLTQLCNAALVTSQEEEAFPHALHLTSLAQVPTEFEAALKLVAQLARQLDLTDLIAELSAQDNKSSIQWCVLAELHQILNDFEASAEALAQARLIDDSVLVASQEIRLFKAQGNWLQAIARLRELIATPGGNRPANLNKLIQLLIDSGDISAALVEVEKWKKRSPGDKHAWLKRAELLTQSGRLTEAALELRRAHTKFNQDSDLRNRLAKALLAAGDYPAAERLYFKIYQEADDASARNHAITELAILAKQENRTEQLLADFQRRKRQNPSEAGPLLALARIYEIFEQYDQQHSALAEALRRRPSDSVLRLQLSKLEENAGLVEQAAQTLRDGLALSSGPQLRQALADFYFRSGELELGLDLSAALNQDDPRALEATVLSLCQQQEWELALRHLNLTSSSDPRLQCLRALALVHLNRSQQVSPLLAQLLSNTNSTFPPNLSVTNTSVFKQTRLWSQANRPLPAPELLLFTYFNNQIDSFLQRRFQSYSSSGSQPQPSDLLPGTLAELRAFTLALIYRGSNLLSDSDEKAQFLAQFSIPTVPYLQSFFHPDFREWLLDEFNNQRLTLPQVTPYLNQIAFPRQSLITALEDPVFVEEHPAVAVQVALHLAQNTPNEEEDERDWFARIFNIIPQLEETDKDYYLTLLNSYLTRSRGNAYFLKGNLTPNYEDLFRRLAWKEISSHNSHSTPVSQKLWFHNFRQSLRDHKLAADYIKVLNLSCQEFIDHPLKKNSSPNSPYSLWGGHHQPPWGHYPSASHGSPSNTPSFPPTSSPLPLFVLQDFAIRTSSNPSQNHENTAVQQRLLKKWREHIGSGSIASGSIATRHSQDLDPDALLPFIPQIENKRVRAIAYHWAGATEELEKLIGEFAESNDPQLLLFALCYYYDPQDRTKSFSILKKLPREQLPKLQRVEVDRYWVQMGADLSSRNKLSPEDSALVKKAALRYRHSSEAANNQNYLNNLLTRIDPKLQYTARRTSRSTQYNPGAGRYRSSQKITDKIAYLLSLAQFETAATLSLRHLHSDFRLRRNFQSSNSRELLKSANENPSFKTALLTAIDSTAQKSFQSQFFAAELHSTLESNSKALAILRELSLARPHDEQLTKKIEWQEMKIAHLGLLADPNQDLTLAELEPILIHAGFRDRSSSYNNSQKKPLPVYLAAATRALNATEPQSLDDRNLSWPLFLLRNCAGQTYFGDLEQRSPSLATAEQDFDPERIRLIRENITACLRHPQLANGAFRIATGCQEALGYTPEQLREFALEALSVSLMPSTSEEEKEKAGDEQIDSEPHPSISVWNSYDPSPEFGPTPQTFLITWIAQNQIPEDGPDFQAVITASPQLAEQARWALEMAGPDLATAQVAFSAWQETLDETAQTNFHYKLQHIANRLQDLADMPEAPPLLETIRQDYLTLTLAHWRKQNFNHSTLLTPSFKSYLTRLWDPAEPQILRSVLERIITQSLGDQSLWPDFVTLSKGNQLPIPLRTLSNSYREIISSLLAQDQELNIFPTLLSLPPLASSLRSSNYRDALKKYYSFETDEEGWEAFQKIDLDNFTWHTLAFGSAEESETFFHSLCYHFSRRSNTKKHILEKLTAQESSGLKSLLIAHYLAGSKESKENLLVHLEENSHHILALPESEQKAISTLLQPPFPAGEAPPTSSPHPNATHLLLTLNKDRRSQFYSRLQQLLSEGFTTDDLIKNRPLTEKEIIKLVNLSLFEKPSLASQLTIKYLSSLREILTTSTPERVDSDFESSYDSLLQGILTESRPFIDYIPYLTALEASPLSAQLPFTHSYSTQSSHFNAFIDTLPGPVEDPLFHRWHWDDLAQQLQNLSPQHRQIASYHFLIHHKMRASQTTSEYWKWAEDSGFRERHPRLCEDLLLSLAFSNWGQCSPEQKSTLFEIWQNRLSDSSISIRLRVSLATHAMIRARDFLKEPAALIATIPIAREWLSQSNSTLDKRFPYVLKSYLPITASEQAEVLNSLLRECLQKVTSDPYLSFPRNNSLRSLYLEELVPLFLQLEDRESFQTLSQALGQTLSGRPKLLFLLAKMNDRKSINHLLAREDSLYSSFKKKWNSDTAKEVSHLLSFIDDPKKRYRLECHLSCATDDTRVHDQTFLKRPERILRLAKQFEELAPQVPTARIECLAKLSAPFNLERARLLEAPLAETYQRWPFPQALESSRDIPSSALLTISETYLKLRIAQGDWTPAITAARTLFARMQQNDRSFRDKKEALSKIISLLTSQLLEFEADNQAPPIDPELALLAKELLPILGQKERVSGKLCPSILYLAIVTHQRAKNTPELFAQLTKHAGQSDVNYLTARTTLVTTTSSHQFELSNQSRKILYLESLTKDPTVSQHLFASHKTFAALIRTIKFDKEPLSEWSLQLPADYPRRAELLLGAANTITKFERREEFSVPVFETALAQAEKDQDEELISLIKICTAVKIRATDRQKAAELIKLLTLSDLSEDEQKVYKYLFEWAETVDTSVPNDPGPGNP
ncbi:MAG: tetratricopeptide repeat protein [Roseibacillus sp.]